LEYFENNFTADYLKVLARAIILSSENTSKIRMPRKSRSRGVVWNSCAAWLTMAIPDVEILAVRLFTIYFNVFTRWHQRLWFKLWEREMIGLVWGGR